MSQSFCHLFVKVQKIIEVLMWVGIFTVTTFAQSPDTLSQYFTPVSLQNPDSAWQVLKPNLKGKKLFLFGEAHGVACNKPLQLSLLKYLHKHANVRNLLLEVSPSEGFLYDHYLRTGDKKYLMISSYRKVLEVRYFWDALYKFNKTLALTEKIRVFGIDVYNKTAFLQAMILMFWDANPHDSVPSMLSEVNNQLDFCFTKLRGVKKLRKLLKKDYTKQAQIYQNYLGNNFWYFQYIINNTLFRYNDRKRDLKMYQNALSIFNMSRQGNFLGVLGEYHVNAFQKDDRSFYYYLNHSRIMLGNIFTLHAHYKEVEALYRGKINRFRESGLFLQRSGYFEVSSALKIVDKHAKSDITLIPLRQLIKTKYHALHGQDYLLYFRDQKAETLSSISYTKRKN